MASDQSRDSFSRDNGIWFCSVAFKKKKIRPVLTQEKKNIRLLALLLVLLCATVVTYWIQSAEQRQEVDANLFKVGDLTSVSKVKLTSSKDTITLSYNGTRWMVNEQYPADNRMIQVLFATLQQVEPKRPIAASQADSTSNAVAKNGVLVSLFAGEALVKSFVAGGNAAKTQSFFLDRGGDTYLVAIPGYKVYVSGIFELTESGFRDKHVFGFNWRNFKSLKTNFSGKPIENFVVSRGKDFFTIEGMNTVDTAKLNTYLDKISLLKAEEYLSPDSAASWRQTSPWLTITVSDLADRTYELSLFQPQAKNKAVGLINRQPALFSIKDIRDIVRPRSFFAKR